MRRGVAVAAHVGSTGLGNAQLWSYDVNDALVLVPKSVKIQTKLLAVLHQLRNLLARLFLLNRKMLVDGWNIVVGRCHRF